jgi:hypothetical protein
MRHARPRVLENRDGIERFPYSLNIGDSASDLRIQLQTDPRYAPFVDRAQRRDVLGIALPVAEPEHVLKARSGRPRTPLVDRAGG